MKTFTTIIFVSIILYSLGCSKNEDNATPLGNNGNNNTENPVTGVNTKLIHDIVHGKSIVVIGNVAKNFIVSFINEVDGSEVNFEPVEDSLPIIMKDKEENYWTITGEAVKGPKTGTKLKPTKSFMGFWFSWGTFFPGVQIYNDSRSGPSGTRPYLDGNWLIPQNEVLSGGPPKDGIPALLNPEFISANAASYLENDDLVLGYKNGDDIRAYPHDILDWHEIINDEINGEKIVITYCPLTGTGIGWLGMTGATDFTFGVSGKLYNTNLIPYDRETDSYWSQIRLDCVYGSKKGDKIEPIQLIETNWGTWQQMYPTTKVVSTNTGYTRNYGSYPYGAYKTSDLLLFPVSIDDERLQKKEIVHGVIVNDDAKVYRFQHFSDD